MTHKKIIYTVAYTVIFFISVQLFSCTDCSKPVWCPGYSDELLDAWFPYKDKDSLLFTTNTGLSQKFTFILEYQSEGEKVKKSRGCHRVKFMGSVEKDNMGRDLLYLELRRMENLYNNEITRTAEITVLGNSFNSANWGEHGAAYFTNPAVGYGQLQFQPSVQFNGRTFTNVQSVYFDTTVAKKPSVYKIYISKTKGLIAYETLEGSLLWVKQ